MSTIIAESTRSTHRAPWRIALAAFALSTIVAGAMPAVAMDPQATPAQIDDALNHGQAAGPYAQGAYDYAPAPHRAGPYASARSHQPAAPARHKDFQDYK
jgi:hypothetical protein